MSIEFQEFQYFFLKVVKPVAPALAGAVILSMAVFLRLASRSRNVWVNESSFSYMGLFFRLGRRGTWKLACSWLKAVLVPVLLLSFDKFTVMHYVIFMIPGILLAALSESAASVFQVVMWLALELVGLFAANLICGYYIDISGSPMLLIIYIVMSVFLVTCGFYVFVTEVEEISMERLLH